MLLHPCVPWGEPGGQTVITRASQSSLLISLLNIPLSEHRGGVGLISIGSCTSPHFIQFKPELVKSKNNTGGGEGGEGEWFVCVCNTTLWGGDKIEMKTLQSTEL